MDNCDIQADPDLLGIGVRIGFYFQFASNLVLIFSRPDEALGSITLSNMFMIAYFAAAIYSLTLNHLPPGAIIPVTSFLFLDASLASVIYFATIQTMSYWTSIVFTLRYAAICGFQLWFWFYGLHVPHSAQCIEPRVWMFGNLPAYGGINAFYEIFSVAMSLHSLFAFFKMSKEILKRLSAGRGSWRTRWAMHMNEENNGPMGLGDTIREHAGGTRNDEALPQNQEPPITWTRLFTVLIAGSLLIGVAVIGVELEIRWNQLANLNTISSTGQILPLVVGTLNFARALVLILIDLME